MLQHRMHKTYRSEANDMSKVFGAVSIAFFLLGGTALCGQGQDDHDDNGPIQTGYAVITTATSTTSGISVVETFGLRKTIPATQAGVIPPPLVMSAVLYV